MNIFCATCFKQHENLQPLEKYDNVIVDVIYTVCPHCTTIGMLDENKWIQKLTKEQIDNVKEKMPHVWNALWHIQLELKQMLN